MPIVETSTWFGRFKHEEEARVGKKLFLGTEFVERPNGGLDRIGISLEIASADSLFLYRKDRETGRAISRTYLEGAQINRETIGRCNIFGRGTRISWEPPKVITSCGIVS